MRIRAVAPIGGSLGDILTTTNPFQINHYPGCGL
jgi:hypothetical protein